MSSAAETTKWDDLEPLESFRERALAWVAQHLERADPEQPRFLPLEEAKQLQASVLDAGFAGIAIPTRFGGARPNAGAPARLGGDSRRAPRPGCPAGVARALLATPLLLP
jgi:alkylation response protein AidB-like acyl-CoA dehydrogenase